MEVVRHWRLKKQRYNLEGIVEQSRARVAASNGTHGSANGTQTVVTLEVEKPTITAQGEIYSYTRVTSAPAGFEEQAPYYMAIVSLDDGPLLTAQLTDLDSEPQIGQRVEMVTRKLRTDGDAGVIVYGYKFRPVLDS